MSVRATLPAACAEWLAQAADGIDTGIEPASIILPRLSGAGLVGAGVPAEAGGSGGDIVDGVAAISAVAQESMASAFVLWGQRTYIEYLLQSPNRELEGRYLPDLLEGRIAGATALSNAMKFLAGLEPLQITARQDGDTLVLDGKMPWVTNLRPAGFHVAAAVDRADGGPAFIISLAHDDEGLVRSADLELIGMRSSDTAAVTLTGVRVGRDRILAEKAVDWLPRVRPAFVGLQCGMSIGLARRAIIEAGNAAGSGRGVLGEPIAEVQNLLDRTEARLFAGLRSREFEVDAASLFELRIELADIVAEAVSLELQAAGGRAYLARSGRDFARRWREAAFVPLITPSLVQLKSALQQKLKAA
ncbi:acyl-CoA dehydrogenase family protein [Mesorhizobium sp. 1B3]|uniref:acyl-CoA dehydrogenase family protein n=1 Tax=Mesorhizobium sp. 1B3 TaxID=3243599 RepID=UPI003D95ED65